MANKIAMLVVCIFLVAALYVDKADAIGEYANCFTSCDKECSDEGFGRTFCEMKCDADCVAKETAAKLAKMANKNP